MHRERCVEALEGFVYHGYVQSVGIDYFARSAPNPVDRETSGELSDPRPDRRIVAKPV